MKIRNLIATWALVLFSFTSVGLQADPQTPTQAIQVVVDEVIALLKDGSMEKMVRRDKIREVVAPRFDFVVMSRSILAVNWKKATQEQRDRFVELFQTLLENTYIGAMEEYSGETVRYGKEKVDGKKASVETFIVRPSGVETPVVYKMRLKGEEWLAYDVIAEGVSLISNYRTSFREIAQRDGMDALLEQMEKKVTEEPKAPESA